MNNSKYNDNNDNDNININNKRRKESLCEKLFFGKVLINKVGVEI